MPQDVGHEQDTEKKLQERLAVLHKRRAGAGTSIGGPKERRERLKLVDKDIAGVEEQLKRLRSGQGRIRQRREAEKELGVQRGGQ